jgi:hypothetical protein
MRLHWSKGIKVLLNFLIFSCLYYTAILNYCLFMLIVSAHYSFVDFYRDELNLRSFYQKLLLSVADGCLHCIWMCNGGRSFLSLILLLLFMCDPTLISDSYFEYAWYTLSYEVLPCCGWCIYAKPEGANMRISKQLWYLFLLCRFTKLFGVLSHSCFHFKS